MHFYAIGVKDELQTDLMSNSFTIRNGKKGKILGIAFDRKLDFSTHHTSTTEKANIKLITLTGVHKSLNSDQKTLLASSFIKFQFNYCPLIWMFCSKEALRRLNKIICPKIASRYILNFVTL